ncbi:MAG: NADH-quinone oxidoreductase subunit N [Oligoflexia bacterium]|nr:NADH-quinone oxidoreductase subunit N [Oligoflexia bacterium]
MPNLPMINPQLLSMSPEQVQALMPYFLVCGGTIIALLACVLRVLSPKWPVFLLTLATCAVGICSSIGLLHNGTSVTLFNSMMVSDPFASFFNVLFLASAAITAMISFRYLDREKIQHPEYFVLLLFAAFGMMIMTSATDLVMVFIALELMSLSVYALVGFRRTDRRSNEAAMKYFILGSAASAVMLYGAAMLYGATGSMEIHAILQAIRTTPTLMTPLFTLGVWLVVAGFLFKVASVPFHMWMPDVYEGAPAPVTGFMTTGLKAAAFATFVRVFVSLGYGHALTETIQTHFHNILWVIAVLTMALGNFVALTQTNLKRMLGYSSIAHTGYLLVGLIAGSASDQGYAPMVVYLVAYSVMNLGAFIILTVLASRDDGGLNLPDLAGLSRRHPWLAFSMAVFLFSMAGIPPTAGFAAKYMIFSAGVQAGEIPLVVISVLCSAVSVYYYLRVLVYMYMRDPVGSPAASRMSAWSTVALAAMVAMTLQIGIMPARALSAAKKAVTSL